MKEKLENWIVALACAQLALKENSIAERTVAEVFEFVKRLAALPDEAPHDYEHFVRFKYKPGYGISCDWVTKENRDYWLDKHYADQARIAELEKQVEQLHAENMCDACGGNGTPVSGLPCMCGGTGKASDAVNYLRQQLETLRNDLCLESAAHDETKQRIADLEKRIAVAVKMVDANTSYGHIAWNSMYGIKEILTMPQPDFDRFCRVRPEYLP